MLSNVFDLSSFERVEIVPIADVHLGNPLCAEQEFFETIQYVLEEPDDKKCARVCMFNGDLAECITRTSKVGDLFEGQIYSPQTQVAMLEKYLLPLMETSKRYPMGKVISNSYGNHDHTRQYKDSGISVSTTLACRLGLEDRSSEDGCYTFIKLKTIYSNRENECAVFTVYNQHMSGGGTTTGAKANRVAKISNGIIADLIVGSHVHTPMTFKEDIIIPQTNTQTLRQQTITYVITNAFLRFGDYSQRTGMKPATIKVPRIFLTQERKYRKDKKRYSDERIKNIEVIL